MSDTIDRLRIVIFGLSLTSSWGNGHATTYRSLIRGLTALGHEVLFLERDVPWYADARDLPEPDFCKLELYDGLDRVLCDHAGALAAADAVIVGSYVPQGRELIERLARMRLRQFCFYDIDTPVTLAALERGEEDHLARRQIPLFDIYLSFSGGAVLTRLERDFGARRAEALYCAVDAERYAPTGDAMSWELGYLGTYSPDRQPTLERLLIEPARRMPERRFVVAGAQFPDDIDWPDNVERIAHLPPAEHAAFYSRQRWTLNVTRADMRRAGWSPSVRLFEAAACGTPIVSDTWPGLDEVLPVGEAILTAASPEEMVAILGSDDEPRRTGLATTARRLVLARHDGKARAAELVGFLTRDEPGRPAGRATDSVVGEM